MPETTPLIKAALNLRVGAGFDVYIATLAAPVIQILSILFGWNHMPANARFTGFCIGMLGDIIFLVSVLCMKDSWRAGIPDKGRTKLVTTGIYRYSRNPAFLGFDFMYVGLLLMYFNLSMLVVSAFAIIMLHLQILQEERYLTENYGDSYREYRKHVFRYLGRKLRSREKKEAEKQRMFEMKQQKKREKHKGH